MNNNAFLKALAFIALTGCVDREGGNPPPPSGAAAVGHPNADVWYLTTDDKQRLFVKELGQGDPVIVLHGGWGAEHSYLIDAVAGLERNRRFIFYDQRGSLRSPADPETISLDRMIADLDLLRRELQLGRVTLLGHSMGTLLAQAYATRHPERVDSLVLVGAVWPVPQGEHDQDTISAQFEAFQYFAGTNSRKEIQEESLDRPADQLTQKEQSYKWQIGYAAHNIYHVERWREIKGGMAFFNEEVGAAVNEDAPEGGWNLMEELQKLDIPITVILGDHDLVDFGAKIWRDLIEDLPNGKLVVLEQAGHLPWIDQPDRFRSALQSAL